MIRVVLVAAFLIYILIIAVQIWNRPSLWLEGFLIGAALAAAVAMYWFRDRIILDRWEKAALWAAVLLFLVYGLARLGGLV
ncbi:MAG TPA: hypothetical protein PK445_06150 [Methanolinea sp.]|jgi:hypothetical protein|nr:hypothetical protein [Methanolinea sp.]HQI14384.1 hypothetical protein [Methanolinea sp.]HRU80121.1 hypothetical protein [Methanolinea sp.]